MIMRFGDTLPSLVRRYIPVTHALWSGSNLPSPHDNEDNEDDVDNVTKERRGKNG